MVQHEFDLATGLAEEDNGGQSYGSQQVKARANGITAPSKLDLALQKKAKKARRKQAKHQQRLLQSA